MAGRALLLAEKVIRGTRTVTQEHLHWNNREGGLNGTSQVTAGDAENHRVIEQVKEWLNVRSSVSATSERARVENDKISRRGRIMLPGKM